MFKVKKFKEEALDFQSFHANKAKAVKPKKVTNSSQESSVQADVKLSVCAPLLAKMPKGSKDKRKKKDKAHQLITKDGRVQKRNKNQLSKGKAKITGDKMRLLEDVSPQTQKAKKDLLKEKKKLRKGKQIKMEVEPNAEDQDQKDPQFVGNSGGLQSFMAKLHSRLKGGRFRFLNELLYTSNSKEAQRLFDKDPTAFDSYHEGYQQQLEKWPSNPLQRITRMVMKLPKTHILADMGCGTGELARAVPHKVYSIDLVSRGEDIIASDMANTPLASSSVDCVVYCLSLMGTNLKDFLLEANRILKKNGLVFIAEVAARFLGDASAFYRGMEACGFELSAKEEPRSSGVFLYLQYRKVREVPKQERIPGFSLNPCVYRKR